MKKYYFLLLFIPIFIFFNCANNNSKYMLDKNYDIINGDKIGANVLTIASFYGHLHIIKYLIEKGININYQVRSGTTALIEASNNSSDYEVVKYLIEQEAAVNVISKLNINAIWCAVDNNQPQIVALLLENGAHVNHKTQSGWSLLSWANYYGYDEAAHLLCKYGAVE